MKISLAILVVILGWFLLLDRKTSAAPQQEVLPYKVAQTGNVQVWKLVHQGCEIFIAETPWNQHDDSLAIATGRGCR